MTNKQRDEILNGLNPYIKIPEREQAIFLENIALAAMLIDNVVEICGAEDDTIAGICVNCNDVFVPAADAEDVPEDKIEELYKYWKEDRKDGAIKWVEKQRGYNKR